MANSYDEMVKLMEEKHFTAIMVKHAGQGITAKIWAEVAEKDHARTNLSPSPLNALRDGRPAS